MLIPNRAPLSPPAVLFPLDDLGESEREEAVKAKELSILKLGEVLAKHGMAEGERLASGNGILEATLDPWLFPV